jgi:hypothetical protein
MNVEVSLDLFPCERRLHARATSQEAIATIATTNTKTRRPARR